MGKITHLTARHWPYWRDGIRFSPSRKHSNFFLCDPCHVYPQHSLTLHSASWRRGRDWRHVHYPLQHVTSHWGRGLGTCGGSPAAAVATSHITFRDVQVFFCCTSTFLSQIPHHQAKTTKHAFAVTLFREGKCNVLVNIAPWTYSAIHRMVHSLSRKKWSCWHVSGRSTMTVTDGVVTKDILWRYSLLPWLAIRVTFANILGFSQTIYCSSVVKPVPSLSIIRRRTIQTHLLLTWTKMLYCFGRVDKG